MSARPDRAHGGRRENTPSATGRSTREDISACLRFSVLEGSVRRAGNRLRVTAQLIDASDGSHLWSQRYDRDLGDVFAIQDAIAPAEVLKGD